MRTSACCVCFGSYDEDIGTGREWAECSCKRWLHEDCVDEEDMDSNGKLCPMLNGFIHFKLLSKYDA